MFGNANSARLRKVQYIRSFEQAQRKYEDTKPIRGRADETIRPLSDRGAVDTYNIRKKVSEAGKVRYECWMYRTPVVTYYENNVVVFDMGGWPSASTRTFISEVTGFTCGCKDGSSYISLASVGNVVMPSSGPTAIQFINNTWELVASVPVYEVQLQRKEANNVRARYKEFSAYVNNMLKLREETLGYANTKVIKMDFAEFAEHFKDMPGWELRWRDLGTKKASEYEELNKVFFALLDSGSTSSFYTAFLYLVASVHNIQQFGSMVTRFNIHTKSVTDELKEVMYKYHSDVVFEKVKLPIGKVPNKKYEKWA
jgi:hypothetical protein